MPATNSLPLGTTKWLRFCKVNVRRHFLRNSPRSLGRLGGRTLPVQPVPGSRSVRTVEKASGRQAGSAAISLVAAHFFNPPLTESLGQARPDFDLGRDPFNQNFRKFRSII